MCGRVRCTLRADNVPRACYRPHIPARFLHTDRFRTSHNVAPGSHMPVLRRDNEGDGGGVVVHAMKWGLVPSFTTKTDKPDFFKMFNARCESLSEKASFRRLLPKNRCLVAVEGFYEWKKDGSKKQPYYIHFRDERPLVFAALYDSWQNFEGETLYTFTILTTSSSSALQWLHDRMPVIFGDKESIDLWLDDPSTAKCKAVLKPYENPDLVWYPVTTAIGKTTFDGPECIRKIPLKSPAKSLISKFFSGQQIRKEETEKETESTTGNVPVELKQEPTAEEHKRAVISDYMEQSKGLCEDKKMISGEATKLELQRTIKEEPVMEGKTVSSKSVKDEQTSIQDESVKTYPPKIMKHEGPLTQGNEGIVSSSESLKEELGQSETCVPTSSVKSDLSETLEEEPRNDDEMVVTSSSGGDESESNLPGKQSMEKAGMKRGYEALFVDQKPSRSAKNVWKKRGQKKLDHKSSDDKQSTLHSYFGKK